MAATNLNKYAGHMKFIVQCSLRQHSCPVQLAARERQQQEQLQTTTINKVADDTRPQSRT